MSPSPSSHGRTVVTDGRLRGFGRGRSRTPSGPVAPAPQQLAELDRGLLADDHVQLVAGLHDRRPARRDRPLPAHHHVEQRLARQPELAHGVADDRVALAHGELDHLRAEPVEQHGLHQRRRDRGLVGLHAEQPRHRLDRRALQHGREQHDEERDVEDRQPALDALRDREGGEHDRDRAAQARPAEHEPLPHAEPLPDASRPAPPAGARTPRSRRRSPCPRARSSPRSSGNTSRPRIRNSASWAIQARPSWKVTIVRRAGVVAVPSTRPGEVDGEEARAVQGVGGAVGERGRGDRGDGVQAGGRQPHAAHPQHRAARRPRGRPRGRSPSSSTASSERVEQAEGRAPGSPRCSRSRAGSRSGR